MPEPISGTSITDSWKLTLYDIQKIANFNNLRMRNLTIGRSFTNRLLNVIFSSLRQLVLGDYKNRKMKDISVFFFIVVPLNCSAINYFFTGVEDD